VITNLSFLARALETQVNANILSTPTLLTLDNEEARILVGQNIPLLTGSYATTGSTTTVTPFQTFERKDIGLMLRVRPQITEGGTVRLVVYQEVSRIDPTLSTSQSVVLNKRVLESSVVIDDSQIIVLGGLIDDQLTDGTDSVPLLGQIPIAGALFRYDARRRVKTNLLVFLKPTVLRTSSDGRAITSERYDYLMGEQDRNPLPERLFWRDPSQPTLPPEGVMPGTPAAEPPAHVPPPPHPGGLGYWARRIRRRPRPLNPENVNAFRRVAPMSVATAPAAPYTQRISYAFAKAQGVLALGDEGDAVVVLTRPDATIEGLAELKRVLQRPLAPRAVDAERFATELARAYNVASGGVARCLVSRRPVAGLIGPAPRRLVGAAPAW
jgi:hypothetical protein